MHGTNPATTRVVIELDQALAHSLSQNGNHVVLKISAPALSADRRGAPAAAASGGLIGVFRRRSDTTPPPPTNEDAEMSAAPASKPPLDFAQDGSGSSGTTAAKASAPPTAAHPNLGSLQEGTVFPGMGAPGTGAVPAPVNARVGGFESSTAASGGLKPRDAPAQTGSTLPQTPAAAPHVAVAPLASPLEMTQAAGRQHRRQKTPPSKRPDHPRLFPSPRTCPAPTVAGKGNLHCQRPAGPRPTHTLGGSGRGKQTHASRSAGGTHQRGAGDRGSDSNGSSLRP